MGKSQACMYVVFIFITIALVSCGRPRPTVAPTQKSSPRPTATPSPVVTPVAGQEWKDPITGMEFVWIPGGCFQMGSPANEEGRLDDEGPVHHVCLEGFWMGKYEVTQAQWEQVMGNNPSDFKGETHPVGRVSWNDAQVFIQQLNILSDATFRLPSEAEWEYACRAGSQTAYSFGNDWNSLRGYGWTKGIQYESDPVGQFKPNAFGLYDMYGSVYEWTADPWHENYQEAPTDGSVWETHGDQHKMSIRGGSYNSHVFLRRCANRAGIFRNSRGRYGGFRLVRTAGSK